MEMGNGFEKWLLDVASMADAFRTFFDEMTRPCCVVDTRGHFVFANKAWTEATGYTKKEFAESPFWDFLHPDDVEYSMQLFSGKITDAEPVNRYKVKSGGYIKVRWDLYIIEHEGKFLTSCHIIEKIDA